MVRSATGVRRNGPRALDRSVPQESLRTRPNNAGCRKPTPLAKFLQTVWKRGFQARVAPDRPVGRRRVFNVVLNRWSRFAPASAAGSKRLIVYSCASRNLADRLNSRTERNSGATYGAVQSGHDAHLGPRPFAGVATARGY